METLPGRGKPINPPSIPPQVKPKTTAAPQIPLCDLDDPDFKKVYKWLWDTKSIDVLETKKVIDQFNALAHRRSQEVILTMAKNAIDAGDTQVVLCALMGTLRTAYLARMMGENKRVAIEAKYLKNLKGKERDQERKKIAPTLGGLQEITELVFRRALDYTNWLLTCAEIQKKLSLIRVKPNKVLLAINAIAARTIDEKPHNRIRETLQLMELATSNCIPSAASPPPTGDNKEEWTAMAVCKRYRLSRSTIAGWDIWLVDKDPVTGERIADPNKFLGRYQMWQEWKKRKGRNKSQ